MIGTYRKYLYEDGDWVVFREVEPFIFNQRRCNEILICGTPNQEWYTKKHTRVNKGLQRCKIIIITQEELDSLKVALL